METKMKAFKVILAFGAVLFALSSTACGEDEKEDSAHEDHEDHEDEE